jgi:hypothetical protein
MTKYMAKRVRMSNRQLMSSQRAGGRESRRRKPRILLTAPAPAMLGREEEK